MIRNQRSEQDPEKLCQKVHILTYPSGLEPGLRLSQDILQILIDRLVRSHQQGESVLLFPRKILRRVNSALVQDGVDAVMEKFRDHFGGAFECDRILCFDGLLGSIHIF
jgi:hypothetical protein